MAHGLGVASCQSVKELACLTVELAQRLLLDAVGEQARQDVARQGLGRALLRHRPPERPQLVETKLADPGELGLHPAADGHGGTATSTLDILVFNPSASYQAGTHTTLNGGNGPDVLDGSAGFDILNGGNGADVLVGGSGDTLTGGNGSDTFLFRPTSGANTITDFDVHNDLLQFGSSMFSSVSDIIGHTTDTAGGALITGANGLAITLQGVTTAQLQSHLGDFVLA
jgi:RTX calcium-binding nonapeptide repeat (4 copies)